MQYRSHGSFRAGGAFVRPGIGLNGEGLRPRRRSHSGKANPRGRAPCLRTRFHGTSARCPGTESAGDPRGCPMKMELGKKVYLFAGHFICKFFLNKY